ncbi:hypothetical protein P3T22_000617 [Paraburkholderia sp. GAS348]
MWSKVARQNTALDLPPPTGESAGCGAKLSIDDVRAAKEAHARDSKKYSVAKLAAHYGVTRNTMHRAMNSSVEHRGHHYGYGVRRERRQIEFIRQQDEQRAMDKMRRRILGPDA